MTTLILSDHGSYLGRTKEQLRVSFGMSSKPPSYIPVNRIEGILIDTRVTISSGALDLIRTYGIPVIWTDYLDDGMILLPFNSHGSVEVRRAQYQALEDTRGIVIAGKIAYSACWNKVQLLRRIARFRLQFKDTFEDQVDHMLGIITKLTSSTDTYDSIDFELRNHLMNIEAQVAKKYYSALEILLDSFGWSFERRSRRPAENEFNALLNYSYAVLKGKLAQSIAITGLDIYAGFLHTDRSGRESLILDIMEEFRQIIVDEVLLKLIFEDRIQPDMFDSEGGVTITTEVKEELFPVLYDQFDKRIRGQKLNHWFIHQARELSKFVRGQISDYSPYLIKIKDPW